jgi:DNA-binding NarL/FixJ family response regulator
MTAGTDPAVHHRGRIRALVVDDHRLFRVGLAAMLEEHGIDVVATAVDGADAMRLIAGVDPDVVVMDLNMPRLDGVEATRRIMAANPAACVLVLTGSDGTDVLDAMLAGARGYVVKDAGMDLIAEAIHAAASGETALSPRVAGRLIDRLRALESARAEEHVAPPLHPLTARESDVLRLLVCGHDNQAIAQSLFISCSTVKHHVAAILRKLGVANRVQAAVEAVRLGVS